MIHRILPLLAAAVLAAQAQNSSVPAPPKPDLPYLKHADNLVPTEAVEAQEQQQKKQKDESTYIIAGAASSARTPLAMPIFIFASEKIPPENLQLFKLEVRNGHREITIGKKSGEPMRLQVTHLSGKIYRIEVYNELEAGEYSLSPSNSNAAFCFAVF